MSKLPSFSKFSRVAAGLSLVWTMVSCGVDRSDEQQPVADQQSEAAEGGQLLGPSTVAQGAMVIPAPNARLNVVISGNNSCDRDIIKTKTPNLRSNAFMKKYLDSYGPEVVKTTMFVCHQFLSSTLYYVHGGVGGPMIPIDVQQLAGEISKFSTGAQAIVLFGYSYGAYEVIRQGITLLRFANSAMPLHVVSIDAISKNLCKNPSNFFKTEGCRQFPADFTAEDLQLLNRGAHWVNFFQESGSLYHSGPSLFAQENWRAARNHISIDTADEVWQKIRTQF